MDDTALGLIVTWLLVVNAITLLVFGWDKLSARAKWRRIPEATLLTLALIGGSIGARAGQKVFRHKTTKQPFARKLSAILILHGVLFILISAAALAGALTL
ncbi:DUF1294 domain-containing protein [Shimia sediminis]|uniref:DUF1294 domain-containing protein n=1 Tax=Shimia sediminis TaxID=2497945 RepID=UPI000F8C5C07|nr:DUF1294 domain-containing protein [Shimia sediminis]